MHWTALNRKHGGKLLEILYTPFLFEFYNLLIYITVPVLFLKIVGFSLLLLNGGFSPPIFSEIFRLEDFLSLIPGAVYTSSSHLNREQIFLFH